MLVQPTEVISGIEWAATCSGKTPFKNASPMNRNFIRVCTAGAWQQENGKALQTPRSISTHQVVEWSGDDTIP